MVRSVGISCLHLVRQGNSRGLPSLNTERLPVKLFKSCIDVLLNALCFSAPSCYHIGNRDTGNFNTSTIDVGDLVRDLQIAAFIYLCPVIILRRKVLSIDPVDQFPDPELRKTLASKVSVVRIVGVALVSNYRCFIDDTAIFGAILSRGVLSINPEDSLWCGTVFRLPRQRPVSPVQCSVFPLALRNPTVC